MTNWTFPSLASNTLTLVIGLGQTGVSVVRWCVRWGASVRVIDSRNNPMGLEAIQDLENVDVRLGTQAFTANALNNVTSIVISPGMSHSDPLVAPILTMAQQQGIEIIGEIELFARALGNMARQGYKPGVVAITGTNGKTTVTAMARHIAQECGYTTVAAGNISPTALQALLECLETDSLPQLWVLELSSFQLQTTFSLQANAVALLNISQDHIDWHESFEAYVKAKAKILAMGHVAIVNRDDPVVLELAQYFATNSLSFGAGAPAGEGNMGIAITNNIPWLCTSNQNIMPLNALQVRGTHNALNAQAAMLLCKVAGCDQNNIALALRSYHGEPHRMEYIRSVAGINFINDSKGTNVAATIAALNGSEEPVILIAGGLGKGQDFAPLAQSAQQYAKAVVLIGEDAPVLAKAFAASGVSCELAQDMNQAVQTAFNKAAHGDTVLLSPACASMDMFRSYEHRGQCFINAVQELALDCGEVV